jgi:hypothetical protein
MGSRISQENVERRKKPYPFRYPNSDPSAAQPVASYYADNNIPASQFFSVLLVILFSQILMVLTY